MNEPSPSPALRSAVIRLGLAAVVAALLFGGGYMSRDIPARGTIGELRAARDASELRLQAQMTANDLLIANIWVYRATVALDDRNFGLANDAMDQSVRALEAVTLNEGDPLQKDLSEVVAAARALDISVARNLAPQRKALLDLERQVSGLTEQSQALASTK
ncbi:hypothetical protein [Brevundimonas halotolerans]|uniref:Uncharacterized protein n=1 Tax=Brevundimonas halotolerans TaxID=69670 RepID=A0A7W9A235_9CAUL|nr:hypothetical protein [Brevundimonas halotolerans]MBB5659730.1 hypothetical protein [Brevundimonas halotolerans]